MERMTRFLRGRAAFTSHCLHNAAMSHTYAHVAVKSARRAPSQNNGDNGFNPFFLCFLLQERRLRIAPVLVDSLQYLTIGCEKKILKKKATNRSGGRRQREDFAQRFSIIYAREGILQTICARL